MTRSVKDLVADIIRYDEIEYLVSRSSGPGGQNVNKVNSKVTLKWSLLNSQVLELKTIERMIQQCGNHISKDGYLLISSDQSRHQLENKFHCLTKLEQLVGAAVVRPKKRKPTKISPQANKKRLEQKKAQGDKKRDRKKVDWE